MPCWNDMVLMLQGFGQQLLPLHFLLSKAIAAKSNCKEVFHTSSTGCSVSQNDRLIFLFPPLFLTPVSHCSQERTRKMYDYDINLQVSSHVEAVLLLTKLNVERHIEVDVSMDELDVTAAESKATYDQLRDYVWEHHQLKVSNLYIAQVKQKYGIIERENYHKAKNENAKQTKCPKEKEDAIVEALRHFQMI